MKIEEVANFKNEYVYTIKSRGVIIEEYIGKEQKIIIPEAIDNKPVTKISSEAFEGKNLLEIIMPDSIREVGKNAFASNMYLTNIKLSSNLKTIPEGMLAFCSKLKDLTIPEAVTSIGKNSLDYIKLKKIVIPKSVVKINNKVFGKPLQEVKSTTFIVEKGSFADELLSSKELQVEYLEQIIEI